MGKKSKTMIKSEFHIHVFLSYQQALDEPKHIKHRRDLQSNFMTIMRISDPLSDYYFL